MKWSHNIAKRQVLTAIVAATLNGCGSPATSKTGDSGAAIDTFASVFKNPDGTSTTSSYLIASVEGAPGEYSNAQSLSIRVTRRNGPSLIRYKAANADKYECVRDRNWSEYTTEDNFTVDTSSLEDGEAILCIYATTADGEIDSNPVKFLWLHDITMPTAPSRVEMLSTLPLQSRTLSIFWIPGDDPDPENGEAPSLLKYQQLLVGTTPGGRNVFTQTYGLTTFQATFTLPRDGVFYFSIAVQDNAGNESIQSINVALPVDSSAPPSPTYIVFTPDSPVNVGNPVTVEWEAVSDATPVGYYYKVGTTQGASDKIAPTQVASNTVTLNNLTPGTYYISVRAKNSAELQSDWYSEPTPLVVQ